METLLSHCAGMDVHQETIVVCTLVSDTPESELQSETKTFGTTTRQLFDMLTWLESKGITHIAMESTGIYWRPVYNILEGYFDITLANAYRIKNVPGRKTDVSDAEWIAKLLRHGLIERSFVPSQDLRELRDMVRLRKKWVSNLTAEKNRIQKYLECSNVKLGTIISDVFGVSGRNLLARLVEQGYVDADDIDHRVHGNIKKNVAAVADSLYGTVTEHQIFMIRGSWDHIVFLEESLKKLEARIDEYLVPYEEEVNRLDTIPGVNRIVAATLVAEIGVNMDQFPTADHLASWAGVAPGNHESAGKKKSTKSVKGNPHAKTALCEAAWAASKTRSCSLSVKFWKLASRRGKKKAVVAVAHKILTIAYHMLKNKQDYIDGGPPKLAAG